LSGTPSWVIADSTAGMFDMILLPCRAVHIAALQQDRMRERVAE
jgi:hypothetical protein